MSTDFDRILNEALDRVREGEAVDAYLARYPAEAHRVEPLLRVAAFGIDALAEVEPLSETGAAAGRRRLLQAAGHGQDRRSWFDGLASLFALRRPAAFRPGWSATVTIAALILVALVIGTTAVASAGSLPGEALYPVKRLTEDVRLWLTPDVTARLELEAEFAQRRRDEARQVVAERRQANVHFEGILGRWDSRVWVISGLPVVVDAATQLEGDPEPGALVTVEASGRDGTLVGRQLVVTPPKSTAPAAVPMPTGTPTAAATMMPTRMPTERPAATMTAQPTMMPTNMPAPLPSMTARPTMMPTTMPTSMPAPLPSMTAHPTMIPTNMPTMMPGMTPHPTMMPTSMPTEMPMPTMAPQPTMMPTQMPTMAPQPTTMPTMAPTEMPTMAPQPTTMPTHMPAPTSHPTMMPTRHR